MHLSLGNEPFELYFKGEGLILAPILVILAGAFGSEILLWLSRITRAIPSGDKLEAVERPLIAILVGSLLIGLLLFFASFFRALVEGTVIAILAVQVFCLIRWQFIKDVRGGIFALLDEIRYANNIARLHFLIAIAVIGGFAALSLLFTARPSFDADTSSTYLWAAKQFIYHQSIFDNGHAIGAMAKSGFLQLCYGLLLASPMLAHAWLVLLTVVGIALLYFLLISIAGVAFGTLSVVVLLTSKFAFDAFVVPAKFDGLSLAYGSAALLLLLRANRKGLHFQEVVLVAAFIGGAASLSYNNLIAGIVFVLLSATLIFQTKKKIGLLLASVVVGAIASSPTYLQNLLLHSNPIYPFAGNLFPSGIGSTIPGTSYFAGYIDLLNREMAIASLSELPSLLSGLLSGDGLATLQASQETNFGLYFLATVIAPFFVFATVLWTRGLHKRNMDVVKLLVGAGWMFAVLSWAYTQHILRYLSFAIPLGMATLGSLVRDAQLLARRWVPAASSAASLATIAAIALCIHDWFAADFAKYKEVGVWLLGSESSQEYFVENYRYGGVYAFGEVVSQLNHELPPGSKILSFINGNSYFSTGFDVYLGNGSNALSAPSGVAKPLTEFATWQEWKAHLAAQGFEYVVIEPTYLYLTPEEEPAVMGFMTAEEPWQVIGTTNIYKL